MGGSSPLLVDMRNNNFYSLVENKVVSLGGGDIGGDGGNPIRLVGSSHGWLAFLTEESLDLFLWNPVSGRRLDLPSIHNLNMPAHNLESGYACVLKLIVSSASPEDADCRAVLCYGTTKRLAFCCPGRSGTEWISIGAWYCSWYFPGYENEKVCRFYDDFVFTTRQNRLFCITKYGDLERWDLEDPFSPRMDGSNSYSHDDEPEWDEPELSVDSSRYLVVAEDDQVFLVFRNIDMGTSTIRKTIDFDVYKVVEGDDGQLTDHHVESLDGLSMFIGINDCFALSAAQFPELKPNSIYFTDPTEWTPYTTFWWSSSYGIGNYDIGIFDYHNEIFYSCYSPLEPKEEASPQEEPKEEEASPEGGGGEEDEKEEEEDEDEDEDVVMPLIVWFRPNYVASEF